MIRGIGCDVVEVKRVRDVLETHGERFIRKLLTENEWPLYQKRLSLSKDHALAFVASRWAVKEAVSKALGNFRRHMNVTQRGNDAVRLISFYRSQILQKFRQAHIRFPLIHV